jgi:hypothetical protein
LGAVQLLVQQECAQNDVHQRVDVIAKTGGKNVPLLDHHDIGGPVGPDQQRRSRQSQQLAPIFQRHAKRAALTQHDNRQSAGGKREQGSPADKFKRGTSWT